MTIKLLTRAIKSRKPAIIEELGAPRYVVLDWDTYSKLEELHEDLEDHLRLEKVVRESRGRRRYSLGEIKKKYGLE